MNNDPKHRSYINWWSTPPESLDLNPFENLWGSLKQFLCTTHKPKNLEEFNEGVLRFWQSLTLEVCRKYIGHLHIVIPMVNEVNGNPSGY